MAGIIGKSAPVARPTRREPTKLAQAHPHVQGTYAVSETGEPWVLGLILTCREHTPQHG